MGVTSSSRREHFEIAHAKTSLLPCFDFVLAREDYERSKPHPEPISHRTSKLAQGLNPQAWAE